MNPDYVSELARKLCKDAPVPWTIEYHHDRPKDIYFVTSANGITVFGMSTYSGDGDYIGLDNDQLKILVDLVNHLGAI